ncbi:hypothetical protein AB1N83_001783 [Pleurotus pulmonarius]
MKSFFAAIALLSVIPGILGLMINTPVGVVQNQPILLNWQDGQPPYFLSIIPGGQPNAPAIEQFPSTDATSFTWTPKSAGSITIQLRDSTGATAYTDIVNISASTTPSSSSVAASGASSGAPGSSTPATSAPAATSPQSSSGASSSLAAPASGSSTGSVRPSSASVSATPSSGAAAASGSNAASRLNDGAFGLAGLLGFIGAAALL